MSPQGERYLPLDSPTSQGPCAFVVNPLLITQLVLGGIVRSSLTRLAPTSYLGVAYGGSLRCSYPSAFTWSFRPSFGFTHPTSTQSPNRPNLPPSKYFSAFFTWISIMSSSSHPTTHSQAVSDSYPPTHVLVRRVRSLAAALAGGSPPSSPIPSGSGRSQSLTREIELTTSPLQQAASSQGATSSPPPVATGRLASLPAGTFLKDLDMGASPAPGSHLEDVAMESAMLRDIAKALKYIAACLSAPMGGVERVGRE